ncbi:hypothetical protein SESBI_20648 [Sesbania bispinosa]|nr:hypothetical protein SESBI_20648 [Sesbania bispinosa]
MEIYLEHGMSRESNLQFLQVPLIANNPTDYNVQVNEVQNDVNQTEVEENVTHTEKDVNEGNDNVTHTEVEVEVNETNVNVNQTKVPISVPNFEMGNGAMNDNEAEIHENCETEAEVDSDSSEDSMRDVHFEDSEEERAIGADDGFTMAGMGHNEVEVDSDSRAEDNAGDASGVADMAGDNTQRTVQAHKINHLFNSPNKDHNRIYRLMAIIYSPKGKGSNQWVHNNHKIPNQELQELHRIPKNLRVQPAKFMRHQRKHVNQNRKGVTESEIAGSSKSQPTTKRVRKKSNNIGPTIPEFARNMIVSQLVAQMSRVWEQHRSNLIAANSAQGASSSVAADPQNSTFAATSLNLHPPTGQPSASMQSGPNKSKIKREEMQ